MKKIRISSSDLKTNISDIVNEVCYGNTEVTIERHGKAVAKIIPIPDNETLTVNDISELSYGALKDEPDTYFPSEDPQIRKRNIRHNTSLKSWSKK